MKQGKSITELAQELERQSNEIRDFRTPTSQLQMNGSSDLALDFGDHEETFPVTDACHGQIASRLKIPKVYYDRMRQESPELLQANVNHWFNENPEKRLVRTLDGKARAFLSDRYRCLDNLELMSAVLPLLTQEMKTEFLSCEVTENRLYLKVLFPEFAKEIDGSVQKNDVVQAGIVISNSETGQGSLRVEPLIYRLVCLNGMILPSALRKYHVGRSRTDLEQAQEVFRDETKQISDQAFWMQVQDVVRSSVRKDLFEHAVAKLSETTQQKIEGDPVKAIETVSKQFQIRKEQSTAIMRNLIEDGDLSKWGVANAVTKLANETEDYEDATSLEMIGGKIVELDQRDWNTIAKAA